MNLFYIVACTFFLFIMILLKYLIVMGCGHGSVSLVDCVQLSWVSVTGHCFTRNICQKIFHLGDSHHLCFVLIILRWCCGEVKSPHSVIISCLWSTMFNCCGYSNNSAAPVSLKWLHLIGNWIVVTVKHPDTQSVF